MRLYKEIYGWLIRCGIVAMSIFVLPYHVQKTFFYGWVTATPLTQEELSNAQNVYMVSAATAILIFGILVFNIFRCVVVIYYKLRSSERRVAK